MNEINKRKLGNKIKRIRVDRKETLEEFAKNIVRVSDGAIKTTKSNISKWEKGLNVPNDIALQAIANLGNTTANQLIYDTNIEEVYTKILDSENLNEQEKNFLLEIKKDIIPLLYKRINKFDPVSNKASVYVEDRLISTAKAFIDKAWFNEFDSHFSELGFPKFEEDLAYFSKNIPYLKNKKYTYLNKDKTYEHLIRQKIDSVIRDSTSFRGTEKEEKALENTKLTFIDIIKDRKQIEELEYSRSLTQVYFGNLELQDEGYSTEIIDKSTYIEFLKFANNYFDILLNDETVMDRLASIQKKGKQNISPETAKTFLELSLGNNIQINNNLIKKLNNNLID